MELQLATTSSTPSSSVSSSSLHPHALSTSLLPSPPTTLLNFGIDPEVIRLREENETLKTKLELEKLASQGLQLRLSSLEGKFGRLEKLLTQLNGLAGGGGGSVVQASTLLASSPSNNGNEAQPESVEMVESKAVEGEGIGTIGQDTVCSLARRVNTLQRTMSLQSTNSSLLPPRSTKLLVSSPSTHPRLLSTSNSSAPTTTMKTSTSLHQILSSIKILPPSSQAQTLSRSMLPLSTIRSSTKLGKVGQILSSPVIVVSNHSNRNRRRQRQSLTCSNSSGRKQKVLRLFVSRNR